MKLGVDTSPHRVETSLLYACVRRYVCVLVWMVHSREEEQGAITTVIQEHTINSDYPTHDEEIKVNCCVSCLCVAACPPAVAVFLPLFLCIHHLFLYTLRYIWAQDVAMAT